MKYSIVIIETIIRLIIISLVITVSVSVVSCDSAPVEKVIYVPVKDTISEKSNIARIVELEHKCNLLQDSLNMIKDSLGKDLFIAKYKLGRIKYYNDIAAKGNNIKYLRGWINRVLND